MSKPGKSLRNLCKKLGVRLTVKRGKKRVYKSVKVLKKQCSKKKRRRRKFGSSSNNNNNKNKKKRAIDKSSLRRKTPTTDDFSYLMAPIPKPPPLKRAVNLYPSDPVEYDDLFSSTGNDQPMSLLYSPPQLNYVDLPTTRVDHSDYWKVGPDVPPTYDDSMVPTDDDDGLLVKPQLKRQTAQHMDIYFNDDDDDDVLLVKPPLKRQKRWFGKKKKVSRKKGPSAALKKLCKKLKVRLTTKRGYKSEKVLKKQCKNKMKKRRK